MVVDDPAVAARMVGAGMDVVLIVGPGGDPVAAEGPGRLAVMVGEASDPAVQAAAAEMDGELFGAAPTSAPRPAQA